jgi:formate C-acetyltransferase
MLPSSVISLFVSDCIGRARSYYEGGSKYTVFSPHIGGIADAVNCLYAIKKLIFEEKVTTFATYMQALKNNWNGYEKLKSKALSLKYYGTDNDEVDGIYATLLHDFYLTCKRFDDNERKINDIFYPAGVSTFGREIDWLPYRLATAEGFTKGSILAGNASPTPGTDTEGATAVIKSYCKANLSEMVTGTALDIKLSPTAINGKNGVNAIISLIKGFVSLGGYFMQLDCVSAKTLKLAQQNPQEYKTLSVRVSGWNARFITLTKEWQDMVIQRTEHNAK